MAKIWRDKEAIAEINAALADPTSGSTQEEYEAWAVQWRRLNGYEKPPTLFGDDPDRLPLYSMRDLEHMPPAKWFIKNIIEDKGMAMIYGPPKSGKTAVTCTMLWSWLAGKPYWLDPAFEIEQETPQEERKVVYCLLEGREGLPGRFRAWAAQQEMSDGEYSRLLDSFYVMAQSMSMWSPKLSREDTKTWPKSLLRLANTLDAVRPQIVVIDTASRATPGMPENDSSAVSALVDILTDFSKEFGSTPIILHHATKSDHKTIRGSSAYEGAVSSSILIDKGKNDVRWLIPMEQRNTDVIDKIPFSLVPHGDGIYVAKADFVFEPEDSKDLTGMTVAAAAEVVGLGVSTLYKKLKDWGYYTQRGIVLKLEPEPVDKL